MFITNNINSHTYTLAASGIRFREREFSSRENANAYMYQFCGKHNLKISNVYDDKHVKTYICGKQVRFYISRD